MRSTHCVSAFALIALAACAGRAADSSQSGSSAGFVPASSGDARTSSSSGESSGGAQETAGTNAETPPSSGEGESGASEVAEEFPTSDPSRWLNGAPFTLASARGDVVLVEAWHRL